MAKINQKINGDHNIQVSGNYITSPKVVVKYDVTPNPNIHITDAQAKQIKDRVDDIMLSVAAVKKKGEYAKLWNALKHKFRVSSYHLIAKDQFDEVMNYLHTVDVSYYRGKSRKNNNPQWRKEMYTAIYARLNNLNWSKDQLYYYAAGISGKPVSSLTDLSDIHLQKVYDHIFSKRI
jgi:hypothetical protein